jgi:hypothetical protein
MVLGCLEVMNAHKNFFAFALNFMIEANSISEVAGVPGLMGSFGIFGVWSK